ncbi:MAG TPA: hypothetical protein VKF38_11265 [Anaerolineaceae bacterium]|nr:hypothetical protein [Anaerolineaceae bacterium]
MDFEKELEKKGKQHRYNFHDIVSFQIFTDDPLAESYIEAEYLHHEGVSRDAKLPSVRLYFQHREGIFQIPDGFTAYIQQGQARWAYQLWIAPDRIVIKVIGNQTDIPTIQHILVHPSLRYLASHRGVLMLHTGAIANKDCSLIFSGSVGMAKRIICSILLTYGDSNWKMHADDYTFLGLGPVSLAYLNRLPVDARLLKMVPNLNERLSPQERLQLTIIGRMREWSGSQDRWPLRKDAQEIWPERKFCMYAKPVALMALRLDKSNEPAIAAIDDLPGFVNELLEMNFKETRHFLNLVNKSRAVPDSTAWLSAWKKREQVLIENRLAEIPAYQLHLPDITSRRKTLQPALLELLARFVENNGALPNLDQPGRVS